VDAGEEFDIFDVLVLRQGNVEDRMVKGQLRTDMRKMIEQLPQEQREVLVMRHYMDMSFKEIADFTNVSINTALGRMRYALINLRKMLEKKELVPVVR
jgi:RNA polymerase sigma-70 factor (ECF subfamily)